MKPLHAGVLVTSLLALTAAALTRHTGPPSLAPIRSAAVEFVVSSGEDAGPGTLRDAIFAADRLSTRARIVIRAARIGIDGPLPALVNPHGITIEAQAGTLLDAARQNAGVVLQINSPTTTIHGLHIANAHGLAVLVNAAGVELDALTVSASAVGISLAAAAQGCTIRATTVEGGDIGVMAETGVHNVTILNSTLRGNARAGFWFVGAARAAAPARDPPAEDEVTRNNVRIVDSAFDDNAAGVVLANRPTLVQKCRFGHNRQSAILVLGGAARIEDSEFRQTAGTALSVITGAAVRIAHNTFLDNVNTAIMVRDSEVIVERNVVRGNGFGIVAIAGDSKRSAVIRDNEISKSSADAVTLVGGSPSLQRNRILENHSAGLRVLDLVENGGGRKATPTLEDNLIKDNGIDEPTVGVYKVAAALER